MKKTFLFIISAILLLTSCEKQIDIDVDALDPEVVICAIGETGSPLQVRLTYSRPTFGTFYVRNDENYFQEITDAIVTLSTNGGGSMTATRDNGYYAFTYLPQAGDQLTLNINVPGHKSVTAKAIVPKEPLVGELSLTTKTDSPDIDNNTNVNISLFVPITDRASETDYYSIKMFRCDTAYYTYYDDTGAVMLYDTITDIQDWFECQDQLIVDQTNPENVLEGLSIPTFFGSEMLFTDDHLNGSTHTIELKTSLYLDSYEYGQGYFDDGYGNYTETPYNYTSVIHSTFYVEVSTLSRDLYLYRQTMNSYSDDDLLSFFSEPVQIHSNIDEGIGILGVANKKTLTYQFNLQP